MKTNNEKNKNRITLRLDEQILQKLKQYAQAKNLNVSDIAKEAIKDKLNIKYDKKLYQEKARNKRNLQKNLEFLQLITELNRIGNNLNQIARKLNSGEIFEAQALIFINATNEQIKKIFDYLAKKQQEPTENA